MSNHKPATALPWKVVPYRYVVNVATSARIHAENNEPVVDDANPSLGDAAYIAHACNAYPELVEALKAVTAFVQPSLHVRNAEAMDAQDKARALLAKLGEK